MEATIPEALDQLGGVLAGGALTVVTAALLGRITLGLLPAVRGRLTNAEGWLLAYACGSALLSTAVFGICALGLFQDATVVVLALATAVCWFRYGRWTWRPLEIGSGTATRTVGWMLVLPATVYGLLYLVHVLAPETRSDAMGYHLGLVRRYYRAHGFVPLTTSLYAQLSQGAEMLYLFAYSIGRESAAKIVHFSYLVATVGGILCLARRLRLGLAGVFAAVAYFTCPVVIPDAASAYNDCALAFALLAAYCTLLLWWQRRETEWLVVLGILVGFSFAVKYTGVVAVLAPLVAAGAVRVRGRRLNTALVTLALAALPAAAVGLPWLVKNALVTGNPTAPFFNGIFANPFFGVEWESAYTAAMQSYGGVGETRWMQLLEAPLDLVWGERYGGSVGWLALLGPLGLLALRRPHSRWLLAAALAAALPWLANSGARFLIPSLPFAFLTLGTVLERLQGRVRVAVVGLLLLAQGVTSWPALRGHWYSPHLWSVEGFPWRAALRVEPVKWHLARNVPLFLLADRIDQIDSPETRVLSFGNLPEAYFDAELLVSYQGLENQDLADRLLAAASARDRRTATLRIEWRAQELRGLRVLTARYLDEPWVVSEVKALHPSDAQPVPSIADAHPMRWHADRIADGNPFSHWHSRQPLAPGMYLDLRFDGPQVLEGIEILAPESLSGSNAHLEFQGLLAGGGWKRLVPSSAVVTESPVDALAARTAAAEMLRRHGIDFVVVQVDPRDSHYGAMRLIASNPEPWGLRRVFAARSALLLKVEPAPD